MIHVIHMYHVAKDEIGPVTLFFTDFYAKLESAPSSIAVVSIKEKGLDSNGYLHPAFKVSELKGLQV